jgi:hypothetical protein
VTDQPTPALCATRAAEALQVLSDDATQGEQMFHDQIQLAAAWRDLGVVLTHNPAMMPPPTEDTDERDRRLRRV